MSLFLVLLLLLRKSSIYFVVELCRCLNMWINSVVKMAIYCAFTQELCKCCGCNTHYVLNILSSISYILLDKNEHILPPGSCPPPGVSHPTLQLHLLLFWTHICHCHSQHTAGPRPQLY